MNPKMLTRFAVVIFLSLSCTLISHQVQAQDILDKFKKEMAELQKVAAKEGTMLLPDVTNVFDPMHGVELKWYNQYDLIKSIAVQKSQDKAKNYKTIGYLEKTPKGVSTYMDESIDFGTTYYRLLIVFSSDLNWYSNISTVEIDSQGFISFYQNKGENPDFGKGTIDKSRPISSTANTTDPSLPNFQFVPSRWVYYDLFDKQIHVDLSSGYSPGSTYSLVLKDPYSHKILNKVKKIPKNNIIVDPRNFNTVGLLEFELFKDKNIVDKGYINIQ